ncbi:MAG: site-specific integrase [Pseudomonadota bacterium]|nr:site-specific integrase [Pseudomonadota bacterium]MDP1903779.1 site-specific integrase [Pseudomonadota bacterium]MDP2353720.1 site-specific integrase [Pseudomonadota bacterium]
MPKLTKTTVENEQPGTMQRFIWDTETKGFGLKIFPTGARSFVFQYRSPEGRTRRATIGKLSDVLTVEQARKKAKILASDVLNGRDPQGEKQARKAAPTLAQVLDDYLASDEYEEKAASTKESDIGRINRHLRPLLGNHYADKLTTGDVKRAIKAISEGKTAGTVKTKARGLSRVRGGEGAARKAFRLLRAICRWAKTAQSVEWGDVQVTPDGERETIIEDADTYARLFQTLDQMQNEKRIRPAVADAIRILAMTGARLSEVTGMRWQHVDLKAGKVTLPADAHKTGHRSGKAKIISLPALAQIIIARQPAGEPDDYVFRPSKGSGPLAMSKPWRQVRAEAQLPADLGLHGLRHSVASHLAMAGASTAELMAQLGHKQSSTVAHYIHFAENARSTLAERAAAVAVAGMNSKAELAEVVPIRKGQKKGG